MTIRDQADYWDCDPTPTAMRHAWVEALAEISARSGKQRALHADGRTVPAYVSDNRWVAECLQCAGAFMVARWNPEGCCLGCGHVYKVKFPPDAAAGEAALEQRLDPNTRNWNAHHGETVGQLVAENREYAGIGIAPKASPVEPSGHLFVVAAESNPENADEGPAGELLAKIHTGYTIRHDAASGLAEIEIIGQTDRRAASISKAMGGATHEELAVLDPKKNGAGT